MAAKIRKRPASIPTPSPARRSIKTARRAIGKPRPQAISHELQDQVPPGAVSRAMPDRLSRARELAEKCAWIAHDNRARDILLLDLQEVSPLVDFFVIATASARRQASAIASEIDHEMKALGERKLGIEGAEEGRWVLMDYGDFIVHIFAEEARLYYSLEDIWGDAPRLPIDLPKAGTQTR